MTELGLRRLAGDLSGALHLPGDDGYLRATSPRNATALQAPAAVASVAGAQDVRACVRCAARDSLRVAVQATGHGAAGTIGADVLLIDTSGMTEVEIDTRRRIARVGPGVSAAQLSAAVEPFGLLAASGTAPDVGVVGYTVHGGVGWLTRAFGMASASLRAVQFVDGRGALHRAEPGLDDDALWAFRGGGGVGLAVSIDIGLHPGTPLWGGYALWPRSQVGPVVAAWAELVERVDDQLSTVISMLRSPSAPEELGGESAVYLGAASPASDCAERAVVELLADLPAPVVSSFGPCDAARLSTIHLDPPVAVPAIGDGRWLHAGVARRAQEVITAAHHGGEPALTEVELRHLTVAADVPKVAGAMCRPPGDYLLHSVGLAGSEPRRRSIEHELATVAAAAGPDDTGHSAASFRDGQTTAPQALGASALVRLAALRARFDPDEVFVLPRPLS